jgi:hypothetical protein
VKVRLGKRQDYKIKRDGAEQILKGRSLPYEEKESLKATDCKKNFKRSLVEVKTKKSDKKSQFRNRLGFL